MKNEVNEIKLRIIKKVINRDTLQEVIPQYTNKPLKTLECTICEPLKVVYESGSFFTHEIVEHKEIIEDVLLVITSKKIWIFLAEEVS